MSHETNFCNSLVDEIDRENLFGPLSDTDGPFILIQPEWRMPNIMVEAGIFPSLGQAKKNGWDKDIPEGWTHIKLKSGRKNIFIWNPSTSRTDPIWRT